MIYGNKHNWSVHDPFLPLDRSFGAYFSQMLPSELNVTNSMEMNTIREATTCSATR
jgi:hypothetical protein